MASPLEVSKGTKLSCPRAWEEDQDVRKDSCWALLHPDDWGHFGRGWGWSGVGAVSACIIPDVLGRLGEGFGMNRIYIAYNSDGLFSVFVCLMLNFAV